MENGKHNMIITDKFFYDAPIGHLTETYELTGRKVDCKDGSYIKVFTNHLEAFENNRMVYDVRFTADNSFCSINRISASEEHRWLDSTILYLLIKTFEKVEIVIEDLNRSTAINYWTKMFLTLSNPTYGVSTFYETSYPKFTSIEISDTNIFNSKLVEIFKNNNILHKKLFFAFTNNQI